MIPTLAARMADYAIGLRFEDISAATVHEVKRRVIDSLGCALGAWRAEPCEIARRVSGSVRADVGATPALATSAAKDEDRLGKRSP